METQLRQLQLAILDIAVEVKRICLKYNIKFFLIGGSLLGAVRHHGFIPWDDDMDIGMLRKDYEKFISICKEELHEEYFLQTFETDNSYTHPFAKIRINNTSLIEDYSINSKQHNGIYLDIFPYDNMPDNVFLQKVHYLLFKSFKWCAMGKSDYSFTEVKKRRFSNFMKNALFFISKNKAMKKCIDICKMFNKKNCANVINMCGAYKYNEYAPVSSFNKLVKINFEGIDFFAPNNYDELLTNMYGDYMKLPPIEQRGKQHSMVKIDIGNYVIKSEGNGYIMEEHL